MTPIQDRTYFVFDTGMNTSLAETLAARGAGRVLYFCPWVTAFSDPDLADIGSGLPGVERVKYFFDAKHEFDDDKESVTFVFPGVGMGDVQEELVRQGFAVWGSRKAEELELFRWTAKQIHRRVGIAVGPCQLIRGMTRLRDYLTLYRNKTFFIKVSEYRGITESFKCEDIELIEARLDALAVELGPVRKHTQEFIVEEQIPTKIETGADEWNIEGQWPQIVPFGIEIKDLGYLITTCRREELPEAVQDLDRKLGPVLGAYHNRGSYHSEIRLGNDGRSYPIDHTCRLGLPPGATMQEWITNLPDIIWEGARGRLVEIETASKFGFEVGLYSKQAIDLWLAVKFPEPIARWIKLYNHCRSAGGLRYVVATHSKLEQFGSAVGLADTIEGATDAGLEHAKAVKADGVEVKEEMVARLMDEIKAMRSKGIKFGGE
jgi:hypothetical protein